MDAAVVNVDIDEWAPDASRAELLLVDEGPVLVERHQAHRAAGWLDYGIAEAETKALEHLVDLRCHHSPDLAVDLLAVREIVAQQASGESGANTAAFDRFQEEAQVCHLIGIEPVD